MRKGGLTVGRAPIDYGDTYEYSYDYEDYNISSIFEDWCPPSEESIQAMNYVYMYMYPLLLVQGIVGNLIAIPALYSISCCAWSTVIYLALISGVDLVILLTACFDKWYIAVGGWSPNAEIMNSSNSMCKTYNFTLVCIKHLSSWLVVAMAVEMAIATRWPKRTYKMCTLERAKYAFMLMIIIIICLNIHYFWTYGLLPRPSWDCRYIEGFSNVFREWILPALENSVELILPLAAVSICFFVTVTTMIRRPASKERDLEAEMKRYFLQLSTLRDFRIICLILCLIFMCLITFRTTHSLTELLFYRAEFIDMACEAEQNLKLFGNIGTTLIYVFCSNKIYLYLALSSLFRAKLWQGTVFVFRKIKGCCNKMYKCEHQWTPISLQECGECRDQGQSQSQALIHDDTINSLSKVGSQDDETLGAMGTSSPKNATQRQDHNSQGTSTNKTNHGVKNSVSDLNIKGTGQEHGSNNISTLDVSGNKTGNIPLNDMGTHV